MRRDMEAEGKLRSGCMCPCAAHPATMSLLAMSRLGVSGAALRVLIGDMAGWAQLRGAGLGSGQAM